VKRLWLLRHAKSSWDQPSLPDADRPLAPRGQRAAEVLAAHLAASDVRPTVVLCSSSLRTRETLAAILPALGDALEIRIEQALYGAGAAQLLDRLRQVSNNASLAMLIAHNPGILRSKSSPSFLNPRCGVAVQNGVGMYRNGRSGST
jgi:phosphohistidine phosphatase